MNFDQIDNLRRKYVETVVLTKIKSNYHAFSDDGKVLSVICNYEFKNNECKFTTKDLTHVLELLSAHHVSVYVNDEYKDYGKDYNVYLSIYNDKVRIDELISDLSERMKNLIYDDGDSYYKIVELFDELEKKNKVL